MSANPWFPLYFSDLTGDTLALSTEQIGAYILLLGAMWNAGGSLPLSDSKLARIARVTPRRWPAIWAELEGFLLIEDGMVSHPKLTKERQKSEGISGVRADAGARGGKAKARKTKGSALAKGADLPLYTRASSHNHITPNPLEGADDIVWEGPPDIVRAVVAAKGASWARDKLQHCRYLEGPGGRRLVVSAKGKGWVADKLNEFCRADLAHVGAEAVEEESA